MNDLTRSVAEPDATRVFDGAAAPPALTAGGAEYELCEEIGRGGMGVVFRARDIALERDVAVKRLQERFAPTSGTAARFVAEAKITGRLQHPGIPAVYRVGLWADGRPFLAMKLIHGRTLDDILAKPLVAHAPGSPDPLTVFEAIAQAVGYAHSQGVIHRDLKPSNVMVGAFGEVQVMDWGLAKLLSGSRDAERSADAPDAADATADMTLAGSVLGTPAFMPPEQAAGDLDKIDARADVFGLGAILCVLLTGKPPFDGDTAESVRLSAARGSTDAAFARLEACAADPDVISLCKRCLAFDPAARPPDGDAVAKDVARIRAAADDRAKQAERDRHAAVVQTAEQRKRRRVLELAAAVVAVVFAAGLTAALWQAKVARREALDARLAREAADAHRAKADARLGTAAGAIERAITRVGEPLWATRPELQAERRAILEDAIAFLSGLGEDDSKAAPVRKQLARAYLLRAAACITLGDYDACASSAATSRALYDALAADFPRDSAVLRGRVEAAMLAGHVPAVRADFIRAAELYSDAHDLAEAAYALDPTSADVRLALADIKSVQASFFSNTDPARAVKLYAGALAFAEQVRAADPTSYRGTVAAVTALVNAGGIELGSNRPSAAATRFEQAEVLFQELDRLSSPSARALEQAGLSRAALRMHMSAFLTRGGHKAAALASAKAAAQQMDELLAVQPKSFPLRMQHLQCSYQYAERLSESGKHAEARAEFLSAGRHAQALLADVPTAVWVKAYGATQRSVFLVAMARAGDAEFVRWETKDLVADVIPAARGLVHYNAACAFAQLSVYGPEEGREKCVDEAVGHLGAALDAFYFGNPGTRRHLEVDTDFDPIRRHPAFRAWMAKLLAKHPLPPWPAPPPRRVR